MDRTNGMSKTFVKSDKLWKDASNSKNSKKILERFDRTLSKLDKRSISGALIASEAVKSETISKLTTAEETRK